MEPIEIVLKNSHLYRHLYLRNHQNIWPPMKQIYHVKCSVLCSLVFVEQFQIQLLSIQLVHCLDTVFKINQSEVKLSDSSDQSESENSKTSLNPIQSHVHVTVEFLTDVLPSKHQETKNVCYLSDSNLPSSGRKK